MEDRALGYQSRRIAIFAVMGWFVLSVTGVEMLASVVVVLLFTAGMVMHDRGDRERRRRQ